MLEKDNIEDLFKDAFHGFEEPVRPGLWQNISSRISTNPTSSGNEISNITQAASSSSGFFASTASWIGGAVLVAAVASGIYIFNKTETSPTPEKTVTENTISNPAETPGDAEFIPVQKNQENEAAGSDNAVQNDSKNINKKSSETAAIATHPATAEPFVITDNNQDSQIATSKNEINQSAGSNKKSDNKESQETTPVEDIEIHKPYIMAFPSSGKAPLTVRFSFSGKAEAAEWNFGDGKSENSLSPLEHTFDKAGDYTVSLVTTGTNGKQFSEKVSIVVEDEPDFGMIPNVITPNNDGLNDIFSVDLKNAISFEAFILDKSRSIIYKWSDINGGWNGKLNSGQDADSGTYFYAIFATGTDNKITRKRGTLTLIR